jgi:hypothetical protein
MKRSLLVVVLGACLALVALPGAASAHVLKVDGTVGAVLHINPDDNPESGVPTDYVLSFTDDGSKLTARNCDCRVSFLEQGKTVGSSHITLSSNMASENTFIFPRPDVYTVRVSGTPLRPGAFRPFTLNYTVRVADSNGAVQNFPTLLWVGMAMGIGLILLAGIAMSYDENT